LPTHDVNGLIEGLVLCATAVAALLGAPPLACLLVATAAWWVSHRHPKIPTWWVLGVAILLRATFVCSPYLTDDLHRYVWEGRVLGAGFDPYQHPPSDPVLAHLGDPVQAGVNHPYHSSIYPPLTLTVFAAATGVGLAEEGLRILFLVVDLSTVLVLLAFLRARGQPPGLAVLYAWSPVVVIAAGSGHLDPLALLPLAAALLAFSRGHPLLAGVLLGIATMAKVFPVLVLPWFLVRRPWPVAAGFLLVVGLTTLTLFSPSLFGPLTNFARSYQFNNSLHGLFESLVPGNGQLLVMSALLLVISCATFMPCAAAAAVVTFGGLLLLSPTVHFWYLTWVLLPAAAAFPRGHAILAAGFAVSALALYPTYRDSFLGLPFVEHGWATTFFYGMPAFLLLALVQQARRHRPALVTPAHQPQTATETSSFAVVIPAWREARNLTTLLPAWLRTGAQRIVVADKPTSDGTAELAALDPRLCYVAVTEPGYGAAVKAGMAAAGTVDYIVICDADHDLGPAQVSALLAPFADPEVALVCAARGQSPSLSVPQRLGNTLITAAIAAGFGRWFHDLGPYRALRRTAWPDGLLQDAGFGVNVEGNVRALQRGMKVVEVMLPAGTRAHGRNRISATLRGVVRAGKGMIVRLFRLGLEPWPRPSSS
jgi:hypothetical protein